MCSRAKNLIVALLFPFLLSANIWVETDWSGDRHDSLYNIEAESFHGELRLSTPDISRWADTILFNETASVLSIAETPQGQLIAGTAGGEVLYSDDGRVWNSFPDIEWADVIYQVGVYTDGSPLAAKSPSPSGIYRWDGFSWELLGSNVTHRNIRSFVVTPLGFIYIGTGDVHGEIYEYNPFENSLARKKTISGARIIHTLIRTPDDGWMWAGGETATGGFVALSKDGWVSYEMVGTFPPNVRSVYSLVSTPEGIFAGTGDIDGDVFLLEGDSWGTLPSTPHLHEARSLAYKNALYVSGRGYDVVNVGLCLVYRDGAWQRLPTVSGIVGCPSILINRDGVLFAGTTPGGILKSSYVGEGFIISNIHDLGTDNRSTSFGRLLLNADALYGEIEVRVRTDTLIPWEDCIIVTPGDPLQDIPSVIDGDRFLQYRIDMRTDNPETTPIVHQIAIEYTLDTIPPYIVSARASDGEDSLIPGIDIDDYVAIKFSEPMLDSPDVGQGNIDSIFYLSPEGSWLNGIGLMLGADFMLPDAPDSLIWRPLLWPPWAAPPSVSVGDTIFSDMLTDIWGNQIRGFSVIEGSFYQPDTIPPIILSATAYDVGGEKAGRGDSVLIRFSERMAQIESPILDTVLPLSSFHSWGVPESVLQRGDSWKIVLGDGATVRVGDTIYPDGELLKDRHGNPCWSGTVIEGSFGGRLIAIALASDGLRPGQRIGGDDFVIIEFNRSVSGLLTPENIDAVLSHNGTWRPCVLHWNIDSTKLVIAFHPGIDTPDVSIGDTVYPDSATINDSYGRLLFEPFVIEGTFGVAEDANYKLRIMNYELRAYPNPFRKETVISYQLSVIGEDQKLITDYRLPITIRIYDLAGRPVWEASPDADGQGQETFPTVTWDGRDLQGRPVPSGIYFARLKAGNYRETRKIVLLR
ncbi:T9SS type A sorting domain-containing protein [candidate division WOR-3 bacterium]|nr:T9SS type A sorting domain-containing protein [candidate division WOR-3 bacterium]